MTTAATTLGATEIPLSASAGFRDGQSVIIGSGQDSETAVVTAIRRFPSAALTVAAPLTHEHAAGTQVAGSGITLNAALTRAHDTGAPVTDNIPTPGAPNRYYRKP
jgi:non-reducing end alpha-L-arabinofuranosidase